MDAAEKLIDAMIADKLKPNLRTANMYLRGCLWAGDLERATSLFQKLQTWGLKPDFVSVDYMVRLQCAHFQVYAARDLLKAYQEVSQEAPVCHLQIASSAALLGEWNQCRSSLDLTKSLLKDGRGLVPRGEEKDADDNDSKGTGSVEQFLKKRQQELASECDTIQHFLSSNATSSRIKPTKSSQGGTHTSKDLFLTFLPRLWLFSYATLLSSEEESLLESKDVSRSTLLSCAKTLATNAASLTTQAHKCVHNTAFYHLDG